MSASAARCVHGFGLGRRAATGTSSTEPSPHLLRRPWDPRAVSDPWLLEEEFSRQRTLTASGVEREQGHVARETPAKTTPTVPLEFKDNATGEHFDVV